MTLNNKLNITNIMVFLSFALISLSVYQVPLPGNYTLQLFRAVHLVAMAFWLLGVILRGFRISSRFPWTGVVLALVFTYVSLSFFLWGVKSDMSLSVLVAIGFGILYAWWLPQVIRDPFQLKVFVAGIVFANLLVITFAGYQYIAWFYGWGVEGRHITIPFNSIWSGQIMERTVITSHAGSLFRLTLPFSSSSHLGIYIAATMLITFPLFIYSSSTKNLRHWFAFYHGSMFVLLLATLSRGAWIGWIAGFFVILSYWKYCKIPKRLISFIVLVIVAGSVITVLQPEFVQNVIERFDSSKTTRSDQAHLRFAAMAVDMFTKNPFLGNGIGRYDQLTGILHPHNIYLHFLAEFGVVGTTLWIIWLLLVLIYGHRAITISPPHSYEHLIALGLQAAFIAILVDNLFQQCLYFGFALLVPGMIGAVFFIITRNRTSES